MKKLFDNLKILMNRYDLYQADDEVGLALNELETAVNSEQRVFLINYDKNSEAFDNIHNPSDEDFMTEAELQGTVFTLEVFVKHFNMSYSEINQETDSIRIINVPVSLPV
jgi:hypothetical protein